MRVRTALGESRQGGGGSVVVVVSRVGVIVVAEAVAPAEEEAAEGFAEAGAHFLGGGGERKVDWFAEGEEIGMGMRVRRRRGCPAAGGNEGIL